MPAWNAKLDAVGHCYEGDMAGDRRKPLYIGAAESSLAKYDNEATSRKRDSELNSKLETSWDAVMANLRLLSEAHERLTDSSRDASVQYGKKRLALGDILPIFDGLTRLWQDKAEKPSAKLNESNAIVNQRDEMHKERDISVQLMNDVELERDQARKDRDLCLSERSTMQTERDTLLPERSRFRKESERLRQERDALRKEKERLKGKFEEISRLETIRETNLREVERERTQLFAKCDVYRQKRDDTKQEVCFLRVEKDRYQAHVGKLDDEVEKVKSQFSSFEIKLENLGLVTGHRSYACVECRYPRGR